VAYLTGDLNAKSVWMAVAAIAFVDMDTANLDADEPLQDQGCGHRRVVVQRFGVEHELSALR
jgi:hypothetical protein